MWPFKRTTPLTPKFKKVRVHLNMYTVGPLLFIEAQQSERILKPTDGLSFDYFDGELEIVIAYKGEVRKDV